MASESLISGASADPVAATETILYTSPTAGAGSVISSITVANRGAAAIAVRVGVSPGGGALVNAEYLVYDHSIEPKDSLVVTGGITLDPTDEIRIRSDLATASFNVFGTELSA